MGYEFRAVNSNTLWYNYNKIDVLSYSDYYPGGFPLPRRHTVQTSSDYDANGNRVYRYGIQGWEKDFEITGVTGSHYTTYFREHDTRLLRTWSRDPKGQYASPYVMLGNNPLNGIDPDGAWFWEKKNVRQARKFARQTGGEFEKWKDNGDTYASVTFKKSEEGTGSTSSDGSEVTFDNFRVGTYVFRKGQDRSDLLEKHGVGFYETVSTQKSGLDFVYWQTMKQGEAWAQGWGEYNRNGQAPSGVKALAGLNPLVAATDAALIFGAGEDIFGEKPTTTDKVMAGIGVIPLVKGGQTITKAVLKTKKAGEIVEDIISGSGFIYDTEVIQNMLENDSDEPKK
ncbi:MAG: hypothetical protein RQ875_10890 [Vicingaceae bacterium]|nr:hypothetical protein [Vicingaceae bacterium]